MTHRITDFQKASKALRQIARDKSLPLEDRKEARRHLWNVRLLRRQREQTKAISTSASA